MVRHLWRIAPYWPLAANTSRSSYWKPPWREKHTSFSRIAITMTWNWSWNSFIMVRCMWKRWGCLWCWPWYHTWFTVSSFVYLSIGWTDFAPKNSRRFANQESGGGHQNVHGTVRHRQREHVVSKAVEPNQSASAVVVSTVIASIVADNGFGNVGGKQLGQ